MKIVHLFPDLMNLYGEYGNIEVLKRHLEELHEEVEVIRYNIEDTIDLKDVSFVYMGSGTERNQMIALEALKKCRGEFKIFVEEEGVVLFTGGAMELCGKEVNGTDGLNIIPLKSVFTKDRYTGDVVVSNQDVGEMVGFINKCSVIEQDENYKLFDYYYKDTNIKDNSFEGYRYKNLFGTHLIGPVLVKNPNFMKHILHLLLPENNDIDSLNNNYIEESYNVTLRALKERAD